MRDAIKATPAVVPESEMNVWRRDATRGPMRGKPDRTQGRRAMTARLLRIGVNIGAPNLLCSVEQAGGQRRQSVEEDLRYEQSNRKVSASCCDLLEPHR